MVIFNSYVKLPEGTYFGRLRAPPSFEVHQKKIGTQTLFFWSSLVQFVSFNWQYETTP